STGTRNRANRASSKPAGFGSAAQVEFVVMIGDEGLHPVTKASRVQSFRGFIPKTCFRPFLLRFTYMQVSEKGDFDWALVSCAAVGQKTGSHWTRVAVSLGCADPLCRGFAVLGPRHPLSVVCQRW